MADGAIPASLGIDKGLGIQMGTDDQRVGRRLECCGAHWIQVQSEGVAAKASGSIWRSVLCGEAFPGGSCSSLRSRFDIGSVRVAGGWFCNLFRDPRMVGGVILPCQQMGV